MAHKFPSVSDMTGFLKPAPAWDSDNIPEAQDTACQVPAWTGLLLVVSPPAARFSVFSSLYLCTQTIDLFCQPLTGCLQVFHRIRLYFEPGFFRKRFSMIIDAAVDHKYKQHNTAAQKQSRKPLPNCFSSCLPGLESCMDSSSNHQKNHNIKTQLHKRKWNFPKQPPDHRHQAFVNISRIPFRNDRLILAISVKMPLTARNKSPLHIYFTVLVLSLLPRIFFLFRNSFYFWPLKSSVYLFMI